MKTIKSYDVIIAGAGPAGLNAALLLGRCQKKVLLCDLSYCELEQEAQSNGWVSPGREGCCVSAFLESGRSQLRHYRSVNRLRASVDDLDRFGNGFLAHCDNGVSFAASAVLLASDFVAKLPALPRANRFFGTTLHQCPYCDGWQHHGKLVGVIGNDDAALRLTSKLLLWNRRVTIYTNGENPQERFCARVGKLPVDIVNERVEALEGNGRRLKAVRLGDGTFHPCEALYFPGSTINYLHLANKFGSNLCIAEDRGILVPERATGIQGLFVAADLQCSCDMAVIAAAEGVKMAARINEWLLNMNRSYLAPPLVPA